MKKLKLKKSTISALSSSEQEGIIGGNITKQLMPEATGSRLLGCGTRTPCTNSCKGIVCIPL